MSVVLVSRRLVLGVSLRIMLLMPMFLRGRDLAAHQQYDQYDGTDGLRARSY